MYYASIILFVTTKKMVLIYWSNVSTILLLRFCSILITTENPKILKTQKIFHLFLQKLYTHFLKSTNAMFYLL